MVSTPSKVIAFIFALTAFAVAIAAGMFGGDPAESVLSRALVVLVVCQLVGTALGSTVNHVLNEYLKQYETDHPVPDVPSAPAAQGAGTGGSGGGVS